MQKKISIITTVYNEPAEWLARCFDSVTEQADEDVELVIVDDGSAHATAAFCDEYAERHTGCKLIHQLNGGVSSARNTGLNACAGDYVTFLDADDLIEPGAIKALRQYIETDAQLIIANVVSVRNGVASDIRVLPLSDRAILSDGEKKKMLLDILSNGSDRPASPMGMQTCWGKLYSLPFLKEHGIRFHEGLKVAEDVCFLAACVNRDDCKIVYADMTMYRRHINTQSLMNRVMPDIFRNDACFIDELKRITSERANDPSVAAAMNKRYCLCVFGLCRYFICHRDNPMTDAEKAAALRELISSEPYRTGIRKTPLRLMTKKNALRLLLLKLRMVRSFMKMTQR